MYIISNESAKRRANVEFLTKIHSHLPFCKSAALVSVKGGFNRLSVRREREWRWLFLDDKPLAAATVPSVSEHESDLRRGASEGIMAIDMCRRASEELNRPYVNITTAADRVAPILSQFSGGQYVVCDIEQFPCVSDQPDTDGEIYDGLLGRGHKAFDGSVNFLTRKWHGFSSTNNVPLYLWSGRDPASLDFDKAERFMKVLSDNPMSAPRPVVLYLNGAVSLILDGHHKVAAAAMLGKSIRCTLVFKVEDGDRIARCIQDGELLFLNTHGRYYHVAKKPDGTRPLVFSHDEWDRGVPFIADKRDMIVSPMVCLETAHASLMTEEEAHCLRMGWMQEGVSGCSCTASKNDFVSNYHPKPYHVPMRVLNMGTNLHIGHLKETLDAVMGLNNGRYEHGISEEEKTDTYVSADWHAPMSNALIAYHELFPESKWVSDSDADALRRGEQQNEWCEYYRYEHPMIGDYILNRVMGKIQGLPTAMKCCLWDVVGYLQGEGSIEEFIDTFRNDMSLLMHIIGRNGREIYERLYPHELAFVHELETLYLKPYKRSERPALDSKLVQLVSEYAEKEFDRKEFITN